MSSDVALSGTKAKRLEGRVARPALLQNTNPRRISMNDSNNGKREHKTVDEWSADIDREVNGKRGAWKILSREVFSSRAYRDLSLPQREVLHCYLNKVKFTKPDTSKRRMRNNRSVPENPRDLIVTNNEIKARRGVTSDTTISKARKRLVEIGFLEVIRPCRFPQPGVFGLSDRWKEYPNGDYKPKDNRPASFAPYSRQPVDGRFRGKDYDNKGQETVSLPLGGQYTNTIELVI